MVFEVEEDRNALQLYDTMFHFCRVATENWTDCLAYECFQEFSRIYYARNAFEYTPALSRLVINTIIINYFKNYKVIN